MRSVTFYALLIILSLTIVTVVSATTVVPIGPQYISSNILWALLVGGMLLFILYIGVSCIMSVERPVRMTAVPLQLSKEY